MDELISEQEAISIIDFDCMSHMPADFDFSVLQSNNAIDFSKLEQLLKSGKISAELKSKLRLISLENSLTDVLQIEPIS